MIVDMVDFLSGGVWSGSKYRVAMENKFAQKIDGGGPIDAAIEDHEGTHVANSNRR
jgi:hypothetical protein